MKRFTAPKSQNQDQQSESSQIKKPGNLRKQEQSKQGDQALAVEGVIYFLRGKTDFDIGDFPFVRGIKFVDSIWCVFINDGYVEQHEAIKIALEQIGLEFICEVYYTRKFEEVYQKAEVFFRDLDFWRIVTGEEKNKNAEYVIKNQKKLI